MDIVQKSSTGTVIKNSEIVKFVSVHLKTKNTMIVDIYKTCS